MLLCKALTVEGERERERKREREIKKERKKERERGRALKVPKLMMLFSERLQSIYSTILFVGSMVLRARSKHYIKWH